MFFFCGVRVAGGMRFFGVGCVAGGVAPCCIPPLPRRERWRVAPSQTPCEATGRVLSSTLPAKVSTCTSGGTLTFV